MVKAKRKTFPLKSLLIVLGFVLIGVISAYIFIKREVVEPVKQGVTSAESKARDTQRKSALRSYSSALWLYRDENNNYPIHTSCVSPQSLNLEIKNPPMEPFRDPSFSKQDSTWPDFCYQSDLEGTKFTIWAKLENSYDIKTTQINTAPYFSIPSGFEPNYYFVQSEE